MARSMIMQWRIRENLWLKVETSFFPTNHGRIPRALGRRTLRCCMSSLPWSSRSMCLSSGRWQYNYTYIIYIFLKWYTFLQQYNCNRPPVLAWWRWLSTFEKHIFSTSLSCLESWAPPQKLTPKGWWRAPFWWRRNCRSCGELNKIFGWARSARYSNTTSRENHCYII